MSREISFTGTNAANPKSRNQKGRKPGNGRAGDVEFFFSPNRPILKLERNPLKFEDTAYNAAVSNAGRVDAMNNVAQGLSEDGNRIGDSIANHGLELQGWFESESGIPGTLRLIVFQWNVNNSTQAPTVALVLQYAGSVTTPGSPLLYNSVLQNKITVLWDQLINTAGTSGAYNEAVFRKRMSFPKPLMTNFDTGAQTGTGIIYVLAVTGDAAVATNAVILYGRTLYTDA